MFQEAESGQENVNTNYAFSLFIYSVLIQVCLDSDT